MGLAIAREISRIERHMIFLASLGSTAPFIGLFGTVWGIMNSFTAIAGSQNTSLATVAPGIAEALFATGIGLVAAIPAVVIYNLFARAIAGYRQGLGDAAAVALEQATMHGQEYISVEELQQASGVAQSVFDKLRAVGALGNLPETSQVDLFSMI
jgi:biopolymer transport protein ExbB/TolQ